MHDVPNDKACGPIKCVPGIHVDIHTNIYGDISSDVEGNIRVDHGRHHHPEDDTIVIDQDVGKTKCARSGIIFHIGPGVAVGIIV